MITVEANGCGRCAALAKEQNGEDTKITCKDLQDILAIGMSALNEILHHQLGVHKRCAMWVPHQLTEVQKGGRVQWCLTLFEKYDSESAFFTYNIVSGDVTFVYHFLSETEA